MNSLLKYILKIPAQFWHFIFFNIKRVEKGRRLTINGRVYIGGKGKIVFGDHVTINSSWFSNPIGGDTRSNFTAVNKESTIMIGNNVGISNSAFHAYTSISIGDNTIVGGGCRIWDSDFHSIDPNIRVFGDDDEVKMAPIAIGKNVFIGGGAFILKGVKIGDNSIIAAGSVVTKNVPDNEIWGGNPANFIKNI